MIPAFDNSSLESRFNAEYREQSYSYFRMMSLAVLGFFLILSITGTIVGFSINRDGIQALLWYGFIPITAIATIALHTPSLKTYSWRIVVIYVVVMTFACALYPRINGDVALAHSYGFSYLSFALFLVLSFARLSPTQSLVLLGVSLVLYGGVQASWLGNAILGQHLPLIAGAAALGFSVGYLGERHARSLFIERTKVEDREQLLAESEKKLRLEKEKTDSLLLNMLPKSIAERLKEEGRSIADGIVECTVLFSDIVGFTRMSEIMGPHELVRKLNDLFSMFDDICERYGMEKIKTIGDAYMAAAGVPDYMESHSVAAADMSLDMIEALAEFNRKYDLNLKLRIGLHSGPVIAGIIGKNKFSYDLWGDTVNIAALMESHGIPGRIQVSEVTANFLQRSHLLEERGKIEVKGKEKIKTFWLISRKE